MKSLVIFAILYGVAYSSPLQQSAEGKAILARAESDPSPVLPPDANKVPKNLEPDPTPVEEASPTILPGNMGPDPEPVNETMSWIEVTIDSQRIKYGETTPEQLIQALSNGPSPQCPPGGPRCDDKAKSGVKSQFVNPDKVGQSYSLDIWPEIESAYSTVEERNTLLDLLRKAFKDSTEIKVEAPKGSRKTMTQTYGPKQVTVRRVTDDNAFGAFITVTNKVPNGFAEEVFDCRGLEVAKLSAKDFTAKYYPPGSQFSDTIGTVTTCCSLDACECAKKAAVALSLPPSAVAECARK